MISETKQQSQSPEVILEENDGLFDERKVLLQPTIDQMRTLLSDNRASDLNKSEIELKRRVSHLESPNAQSRHLSSKRCKEQSIITQRRKSPKKAVRPFSAQRSTHLIKVVQNPKDSCPVFEQRNIPVVDPNKKINGNVRLKAHLSKNAHKSPSTKKKMSMSGLVIPTKVGTDTINISIANNRSPLGGRPTFRHCRNSSQTQNKQAIYSELDLTPVPLLEQNIDTSNLKNLID